MKAAKRRRRPLTSSPVYRVMLVPGQELFDALRRPAATPKGVKLIPGEIGRLDSVRFVRSA